MESTAEGERLFHARAAITALEHAEPAEVR